MVRTRLLERTIQDLQHSLAEFGPILGYGHARYIPEAFEAPHGGNCRQYWSAG